MIHNQMPKIDLEKLAGVLTESEMVLVCGIIATRGKNKGLLRASKPKVERRVVGKQRIESQYGVYYKDIIEVDAAQGKTAYLWRQVAFYASPIRQHQCMPVTDFFDLPGKGWSEEVRALAAELDALADKVLATIPTRQQHGLMRWGRVLGAI